MSFVSLSEADFGNPVVGKSLTLRFTSYRWTGLHTYYLLDLNDYCVTVFCTVRPANAMVAYKEILNKSKGEQG